MKKVLVLLWLNLFLIGCAKEHSCEGCKSTHITRLKTSCSITIDNSAKAIYPQVSQKFRPGDYQYLETIKIDTASTYRIDYDMSDYYDTSRYLPGDTFFFRAEVRWRYKPAEFFCIDTLIK